MFIDTIQDSEAEGKLRQLYDGDLKNYGYIPNHAAVFSLRPDVLEAWRTFQASIRKNLRLRRYELVTLAAAVALKCRYCIIAHGSVLLKNDVKLDLLRALLKDYRNAGLDRTEVAMMEFASKVAVRANEMTQADVDVLRGLGIPDVEILDITLAATMRSFASKTFNALGATADPAFAELEKQLSDLLPA